MTASPEEIERRVNQILAEPIDFDAKAKKLVAYVTSLEGEDGDYAHAYATDRVSRELTAAIRKGKQQERRSA